MSKSADELLQHILLECNFILSVINENTTKEQFLADEILKRALVRSLEIIGEATKKIPADTKLKMSNISWKNMAGMRDRLIHDYLGVNYQIVWDVVKTKFLSLKTQIEKELGM